MDNGATSKDVNLTQNGSTWTGSDGGLRKGDVIHWSFGINNDPNHLVAGPDFTLNGYPSCAGSGSVAFPTTTVNSLKYKDINVNGSKDIGEGGLQGFEFQLKHGSDTIDTQRSSESGAIQFQGVAPGTYTIHEVGPPTGWTQTEPANNGDVTVTVNLAESSVTAGSFGDTPRSDIDVTFHSLASLLNADGSADGPATKATSIACKDTNGQSVGSSSSNSLTTDDLKLNQSSVTCVITYTDP